MSHPVAVKPSARERLLQTATRLFYAEGIRAVGIDRIVLESDVAKMTFYNHFDSKRDLVLVFLKKRDEDWRAWFQGRLETRRKEGVLAIFDVMEERLSRKDFRGCAFINTMVETADAESDVHRAAQAHKKAVISIIEDWLRNHGITRNVPRRSYQLMLLIDGAIIAAVRDGKPDSAWAAKEIAACLLRVAIKKK